MAGESITAYVRVREDGACATTSIDAARQGFALLGVECRSFRHIKEIPPGPANMPVGFVSEVQAQLAGLGIVAPDIDYPPELARWMGRSMTRTTIGLAELYLYENPAGRYFIKPVRDKAFEANFIDYPEDLRRLAHLADDTEIWIGRYIPLGTEYRCYVCSSGAQRLCLGICRYRGQDRAPVDRDEVAAMIRAYSAAPAAYTLDVAVGDGGLRLVEVNDGYSVQNYGLAPRDYAIWLMARWADLTGIDPLPACPDALFAVE